jgi:hypothetical protein
MGGKDGRRLSYERDEGKGKSVGREVRDENTYEGNFFPQKVYA